MTICHETPSGQRQTLVLPEPAARAHLRQHPLDTEGPCERPVEEPTEPVVESMVVVDKERPMAKTGKRKST